jgi:hypothetical protein
MISNTESESKKEVFNGAGIGIAAGAGLGLIFGILTDNIGLCVGIGAALGLIFRISFHINDNSNQKNKTDEITVKL